MSASVHALLAAGHSKEQVAKDLKIGITSVYPIIKAGMPASE
jgi:transposase